MKKLNKKGFTLIEMLVVIAIIAILVAIIIPTVSSATGKAKASTDAANLRSAKAVITIGVLDGKYESGDTEDDIPATECGIPEQSKYDEGEFAVTITAAKVTSGTGESATTSDDPNSTGVDIKVTYAGNGIAYYSALAEGKTEAEAIAADEAAGVEHS